MVLSAFVTDFVVVPSDVLEPDDVLELDELDPLAPTAGSGAAAADAVLPELDPTAPILIISLLMLVEIITA